MLEALLQRAAGDALPWQEPLPGVRFCRFDSMLPGGAASPLAAGRLEAFFCLSGRLQLTGGGASVRLGRREVLLLSDGACFDRIQAESRRFQGVLVALELAAAQPGLDALHGLLGPLRLDVPTLSALLQKRGGHAVLGETPFSDGAFAELEQLPQEAQGRYCILKTLELLYLLSCHSPLLAEPVVAGYYDDHQVQSVREVRAYMLAHLAEPMTIPALCRRFHLSSTLLKSCFRALYGRPIHSWLREQRLQYAADLLTATSQPVQQVAAAAGYSSTSQFGVAFRERYRMTPSQYRRLQRLKNV